MSLRSLINGQQGRHIDVRDRGLAYGDGVFETLRVTSGNARLRELHIARLNRGCERLRIEVNLSDLQAEIDELLASFSGDGVLKIIITRSSTQRGYSFQSPAAANRYLHLQTYDPSPTVAWLTGVKLRVCSHRLPVNPALAGIKHLNRLDNVLARSEWIDPGIQEGLMLDSEGRVVEGTMSNLFLERDGALLTPSLQRCGVAGVMRQWVIDTLAPALGITVKEADVSLPEVLAAPAMFICNSLVGICPVSELDGHSRTPGPITLQLQEQLAMDI